MTDPVDTDALRKLLRNDTAVEVIRLRQALSAAADEVDRLRDPAHSAENWFHKCMEARVESNRLRAVIENAPHQLDCNTEPGGIGDPSICTCWKVDAL